MGIVCKDVSKLSGTQKSEREVEGKTGSVLEAFFVYLESLPFEDRPDAIVLELSLIHI